jgi:hypothetical protein
MFTWFCLKKSATVDDEEGAALEGGGAGTGDDAGDGLGLVGGAGAGDEAGAGAGWAQAPSTKIITPATTIRRPKNLRMKYLLEHNFVGLIALSAPFYSFALVRCNRGLPVDSGSAKEPNALCNCLA